MTLASFSESIGTRALTLRSETFWMILDQSSTSCIATFQSTLSQSRQQTSTTQMQGLFTSWTDFYAMVKFKITDPSKWPRDSEHPFSMSILDLPWRTWDKDGYASECYFKLQLINITGDNLVSRIREEVVCNNDRLLYHLLLPPWIRDARMIKIYFSDRIRQ